MHDISPDSSKLVVQGDFESFLPQELFDYWTTASLVTQWWPEEAEILPGPGGHYTFTWPTMGWTLQGDYTEFAPPSTLGFSWKWNHEPVERPPLHVSVAFEEAENGGTLLTITHEPYADTPEEQRDRRGHLEGWLHFCMKLAGLREGVQDTVLEEEVASEA